MEIKETEAIVEAILFTMGESVELDKIANTIGFHVEVVVLDVGFHTVF